MKEELHIRYTIEQNQDQELDVALKACVKEYGWHWCSTRFNYATGERGLDFDREEVVDPLEILLCDSKEVGGG